MRTIFAILLLLPALAQAQAAQCTITFNYGAIDPVIGNAPWGARILVDGVQVTELDYPIRLTTCEAHGLVPSWRNELCVKAFNGKGESGLSCTPFASSGNVVPENPDGLAVQ